MAPDSPQIPTLRTKTEPEPPSKRDTPHKQGNQIGGNRDEAQQKKKSFFALPKQYLCYKE